jgi:hypothetical protein
MLEDSRFFAGFEQDSGITCEVIKQARTNCDIEWQLREIAVDLEFIDAQIETNKNEGT